MQLKGIMSSPAVTCSSNDTLDVPAKLMWDNDCGALPVANHEGRLVGMITDRDICMAALTQGSPLHAISVSSAMTSVVHSHRPEDSTEDAQRTMRERQIRRVPITDSSGHPVGMVSLSDLARHAADDGRQSPMSPELVQTMAEICQPHVQHMEMASAHV